MQFNDPLPPPVTMISAPVAVVDAQALRAALRLVLTAGEADDVARRLPEGGEVEDLGPVARDALGRARMERWLARLPWRRGAADGRLLGPLSGAPAEAAVALALGVGLRLDGRDLADVLDVRIERAGEWLVEGRRALDREMPDPCRKTAWLVGRYEDRSLDPDERVELLTHLNRCPACQEVIERSRVVDGGIAGEFGRLRRDIAERPVVGVSRRARIRRGALVAGVMLVIAIALVAGGTLVSSLVRGLDEPVPLVAAREPAVYSGWLVMTSGDGTVLARHLATGETRRILASEGPASGVSRPIFLSPGGTRLMTYSGEYSQSSGRRVIVRSIDGSEVGRLEWPGGDGIYYPTGWIDERRVLVSVYPIDPLAHQGQPSQSMRDRWATESRLLAVDVETGDEREVLRGDVGFGLPSPDGRYVAAARITETNDRRIGVNEFVIEVWPVDSSGVSQPLITIDGLIPTGSPLVWAGDGSRLFATQAIEGDSQDPEPETERRTTPNAEPHALVAIGLDGEVRRLATAGGNSAIFPVSSAPDGASVVFLRVEGSNVLPAISYWRVGVDGRAPEQVSGAVSESYGNDGVVWSPDGATLLVSEVRVPYLDDRDTAWSRWEAAATEVIAVGEAGERTVLLTSFSVGSRLLGWLPDDAIARSFDAGDATVFTAPEPVAGAPNATRLGVNSAASNDGTYITLDDVSVGSPLVWQTDDGDTQRLRGSLEDAIWLPGTSGLMTVSGGREGSRSASRLSVLAATNPYAPVAFEPREFDPAGLDGDRERRYAAPRVSPDGLNTSFFVVDQRSSVELWIANAAGGASRVTGWSLPGNRIIEPSLAARWVDDSTLVFVEPRDWSRGMPETAVLRRLTVGEDGSATASDVIELVGHGDDRGIALMEIAVSADGTDIAWRVRHYTELAADDGRFDTVYLAPVDDLTRDVELTRGSPGSGLAWSVDGRLLLVGIDREVQVVDADDLRVEVISGDDSAQFPLWVGGDEIWYSAESGDDATVMRVRVRRE